jgi:hypothetical protein
MLYRSRGVVRGIRRQDRSIRRGMRQIVYSNAGTSGARTEMARQRRDGPGGPGPESDDVRSRGA